MSVGLSGEMAVPSPGANKETKQKKDLTGKVTLKVPKSDELPPFITYFPSGYTPPSRLKESDGVVLQAYESTRESKAGRYLVALNSEHIGFVGTSVTAESQMWNPCHYMLGMYNTRTGDLQLAPIAADRILRMEPRVRGFSYGLMSLEDERERGPADGAEKIAEMRKKRKSLTETFGSKKSRRMLESQSKGAVVEENIAGASAVCQLVQTAAKKDGMLTAAEVEARLAMTHGRSIPPLNQDAKDLEDVYPMDAIIQPEERQLLDLKARELIAANKLSATADRIRKRYPTYVMSRLSQLGLKSDEANLRKAEALVYLSYLIKFHAAPRDLSFRQKVRPGSKASGGGGEEDDQFTFAPSDAATVSDILRIPQPLVEKFMSIYSDRAAGNEGDGSGKVRREKKHNDLLVCTVCVLALHVDNFQLDPYLLARDFRLALPSLVPYFKELGCRVKKGSGARDKKDAEGMYAVSLQIPLVFPKAARAPSRRK